MATGVGVRVPFASPVDREGIDGSGVRVALRGTVALDLVMIRGGEHVHRGFELQLLRGLVEDNGMTSFMSCATLLGMVRDPTARR